MWNVFWNNYNNELKIIIWTTFINVCFCISFHGYIKEFGSYYPETPADLAYSFYQYDSISYYRALTKYSNGIQVLDVYKPLEKKIPIYESPGYAWLIGLLWKITGSLKYYDIQFLQILFFVLSCLLLYQSLNFIIDNKNKSLYATLAVPLFFPLIFLNINPIRDAFCFYGVVMLMYLVSKALFNNISRREIVFGSFFIVFCQWMRPTVFGSLGSVSVFIFFYCFFFNKKKLSKILLLLFILWSTNIIGFWVPWTLFNKKVHGRYFVGPGGRLLLTSLGYKGPNKINPKCLDTTNGIYCDSCMNKYVKQRFNLENSSLKPGMPKFEDKIKDAFWEWFYKDPLFWFKGLAWRIKKVLLLDLTWSTTHGWNWKYYNSFSRYSDRLKAAYSFGLFELVEFLFRRWYVRVIMLFGYLGAFFLLYEKQYFFLGLLVSLVAGGISPAIISHPEHRYLTPFYFIYPLLAGYFIYSIGNLFFLFLKMYLGKKKMQYLTGINTNFMTRES